MKVLPAEWTLLQQIATSFYADEITRDAARSAVIDVIFGRLKCSRISLWRFDGEPGALRLLCFASKASGQVLSTSERVLLEHEYSEYFNGLVRSGIYASLDALSDANLAPMRASYLLPHRVHSMLDAAFMVNGRAFGMVCCEQTDAIRAWRPDEIADLRAIVAKLAMLMVSARDQVLWATPSRAMQPMRPAKA